MKAAEVPVVEARRPPRPIPRIVAVIFMLLSTLAFVLSFAAVVGTWVIRSSAIQSVADLTASADQRVQQTQTDLDSLSQSIAQVQGVVGAAGDRVKSAANRVDQADPVLTAIGNLLDSSLGSSLDNLTARGERLRDAVAALDSALSTLRQIPIVGRVAGDALDQADAVVASVQDALQQAADVRQSVSAARDSSGGPIPAALDKVDSSLTQLQGRLNTAQERLAALKQDLGSLRSRTDEAESTLIAWITYVAIALSVMLLGTSIAMISIFVQSLSFYLGRDVLARWRHG